METNSISFNVSKTINIGNFEAIKINYGQSITIDPNKPVEIQREMLIEECYNVVKKETEIWQGLKTYNVLIVRRIQKYIKPDLNEIISLKETYSGLQG